MSSAASFAAAVLAGGASTRMGRDKALIEMEGTSLLERQLRLLASLRPAELWLSGRCLLSGMPAGIRTVPDRVAGQGPLGGLDAVLSSMGVAQVLVVAVDMPFLSEPFLRALLEARIAGKGIVPRSSDGLQPLAAVYPRTLQPVVERRLAAGLLSLRAFVEECCALDLVSDWPVPSEFERCLMNCNSPADLDRAGL